MIPPETSKPLKPALIAQWQAYTQDFLLGLVEIDQTDYAASHLLTLYAVPQKISDITKQVKGQFEQGEAEQDDLYFKLAEHLHEHMSLANQYAYHKDLSTPESYTPQTTLRYQGRLWLNALQEIAEGLDQEYNMWPSSQLAAEAILLEPKSLVGYRIIYDYVNRDKSGASMIDKSSANP